MKKNNQEERIICGRYEPVLPQPGEIPRKPDKHRVIREDNSSGSETTAIRRKIARKHPFKSPYDPIWLADPHQHWAETFILKVPEKSSLLSIDFNSAYPQALIDTPFSHPAKIKYQKGDFTDQIIKENLKQGIFCCHLEIREELDQETKNWFQTHHYLRYTQAGKSNHFAWPEQKKIETLLFPQDILALQNFVQITTIWGIFDSENPKGIPHPLQAFVNKLLIEKSQETDPQRRKEIKSQLVAACSTQRKYIQGDPQYNVQLWTQAYGPPKQENFRYYKDVSFGMEKWKGPNQAAIHSFYTPIRATVRTQLFKLALQARKTGGELIRTHTDGLTISAKSDQHRNEIQKEITKEFSEGSQPGQIRCLPSQHGFFLGPNLWWTYNVSPKLEFTESNGTRKETPLNPILELQLGDEKMSYNALHQCEQGKFLRGNNWIRPQAPFNIIKFRERRKKNTYLQKIKIFNDFKREILKIREIEVDLGFSSQI